MPDQHPEPSALAARLQLYASIVESSADAIVTIDLDGIITSWNAAAEQVYGQPAAAVLGHSLYAIVDASLAAATRANVERIRIGESFKLPDTHWPGPDGRTVHLAVSLSPILDAAGKVTGVASFGRNIAQRKRAEQELRIAAAKYTALFDTAPVAISVADDAGRLVEGNRAAEQILGLPARDIRQRTYDAPEWKIIRPDGSPMPPGEFASVRAVVEQQRIDNVEMGIVHDDGEVRWISVNAAPLDLPGYQVIASYIDITERKGMEEAVEEANRSLEARVAERTAALEDAVVALERANAGKDAFLAAVSHELRTPLTGILSVAEVLRSQIRGELNQYQLRYVETIEASGQRLQATIDNILAYTRAMSTDGPPALGLCSLNDVATQALRAINPKASRKQLALELGAPANLEATIVTDGEALLRVLVALLDNAVKFTPVAGRVGLDVTPLPAAGVIELVVWDTGIGLDTEQATNLFAPFAQGDQALARRYEGLGLGLAYVQRKLEVLGGTIGVEPNSPAGTRVIVRVPSG